MRRRIERRGFTRTWVTMLIVVGALFTPLALGAPSGASPASWANVQPAQFASGTQSSPPGAFFNAVSCAGLNCVAAGTSTDVSGHEVAVTETSIDGGITWADAHPATFGSGVQNLSNPQSEFQSVSCSNSNCVAAGFVTATSGFSTAMTESSNDGGVTWAVAKVATFANGAQDSSLPISQFQSVSCAGLTCVAAGETYIPGDFFTGITVTSSDGGVTWAQASLASIPNGAINLSEPYSEFLSISCSVVSCVASGYYYDNFNGFTSMTQTSTDGGLTWGSAQATNFPNGVVNPSTPTSIALSVSCASSTCVAVGYFDTPNADYGVMTDTSSDGGVTWGTAQPVQFPNGVQFSSHSPQLRSVSCSSVSCVAAGYFLDSSGTNEPLTVSSSDGGLTWSMAQLSSFASGVQGTQPDAGFNSVSCSGLVCVAAGVSSDTSGGFEAMVQGSTDGGATWASPQMPSFASGVQDTTPNATFNSVSCSPATCVAGGMFSDATANDEAMVDSDLVASSISAVTNLNVLQSGSTVAATWSPSAGATSYTCTLMFGFTNPSTFTVTSKSASCEFTALSATTPYGIAVVANGPNGVSAPVTSFDTTTTTTVAATSSSTTTTTTTTIATHPRPVVKTLVCVRAEKVKRVRGLHPKCPAGYRKK